MQTGVLSDDNIAQVLRGIAQKRKQGILEVNNGDQVLQILFVSGKIVDAFETQQIAEQEIISRIGAAGVLPEGFIFKGRGYAALFEQLESADCVLDLDEFQVIIHQRVLGQLYNLQLNAGAYYSFKIQMVEYEEEYTPTVSVGQLLLDLVAINDDPDTFSETFPSDHTVRLTEDIEGQNIEEGFVIHALENHRLPAEIEAACMLNTFQFKEILTNFYNRGQLTVQLEDDIEDELDEDPSLDDIVATLEDGIDTDIGELDLDKIVADVAVELEEAPLLSNGAAVEEDEDFEGGTGDFQPVRASFLSVANAKLLQAEWVPGVVLLLFLMGAFFAPFIGWGYCFEAFSNF